MGKRKPEPMRIGGVPGIPAVTLYPPGSRKGNRFWICRGTVDGEPQEGTSEVEDPGGKEAAWQWWCRIVGQIRDQSRALRTDHPATLGELMDTWIAVNRPDRRRESYFTRLRDDPIAGPIRLDRVTEHDLHQAARRHYPDCKGQTLNRCAIGPWKTALNYAARQGWCAPVLCDRFPEAAVKPRRPAEGTGAKLIRTAAEMGERDMHDWLLFVFLQGWRISETLRPGADAIDFAKGRIRIFVSKGRRGLQKGVWKDLRLHPRVLAMLVQRRDDGLLAGGRIWPWPNEDGLRHELDSVLLRAGLARIVGHAKVKNGRDRKGNQRWRLQPRIVRQFTPHMARWDWENQTAEAGFDGHDQVAANTWTNPQSPSHYRHVSDHRARGVIEAVRLDPGEDSGSEKASA